MALLILVERNPAILEVDFEIALVLSDSGLIVVDDVNTFHTLDNNNFICLHDFSDHRDSELVGVQTKDTAEVVIVVEKRSEKRWVDVYLQEDVVFTG
jgi:hypothetical protein